MKKSKSVMFFRKFQTFVLIFIFITGAFLSVRSAFSQSQTVDPVRGKIPEESAGLPLANRTSNGVDPAAILEQRAKLLEEEKEVEEQIGGLMVIIQNKQGETASLERDIAIINAEIKKAKLAIKARTLTIDNLNSSIGEKSKFIVKLLDKQEREKESLAELLRQLNEFGDTTLVEIILGYENLSDFFVNMDSLDFLQKFIQDSFDEIKITKENTEEEKSILEEKKKEESELRYLQELEKKRTEEREKEKKKILEITRGEENEYQKLLASRKKDIAQIRNQLFILRGSDAIPFEKAIEYANISFKATGVRPAFLLGIIAEESELGANLGSGNWKTDMYDCYRRIGYNKSAEKQKTAFLAIISELFIDSPDSRPVSKAPYYGCGGAMGPAQFMPATWWDPVGNTGYKKLIAQYTGHNPPDPWSPEDAFMAAALLLKDNGAAAGGFTAERRAALRYLAGGNWNKPAYAFYGDDVMALAKKYQDQIDILTES
ncbi:MAG: lytic murein transglycosylase [Candidatus Niyogibacteria bacterium]|nr:lytic murein transglycosylase [Candidatus Niyogibacteria bacterium]